MSVSEFRYAVFSGRVWNGCVELDDELFLVDEGEGLSLSILKYFSLVLYISVFVSITISFTISFQCFLYSGYYLLLFISNFLSAGFLKK